MQPVLIAEEKLDEDKAVKVVSYILDIFEENFPGDEKKQYKSKTKPKKKKNKKIFHLNPDILYSESILNAL